MVPVTRGYYVPCAYDVGKRSHACCVSTSDVWLGVFASATEHQISIHGVDSLLPEGYAFYYLGMYLGITFGASVIQFVTEVIISCGFRFLARHLRMTYFLNLF